MPLFAVLCLDKPGMVERRSAVRADHIAYLVTVLDRIRYAGPLDSDDGRHGIGSLYIMDVADRAACEAFLAAEPYNRAGLFETVIVRRWREAIPEQAPGRLAEEIARARRA